MRYAIVIEQEKAGYTAHVPDLPGCVATAETREEVVEHIHKAIEERIAFLRDEGWTVPEPRTVTDYAEVQFA